MVQIHLTQPGSSGQLVKLKISLVNCEGCHAGFSPGGIPREDSVVFLVSKSFKEKLILADGWVAWLAV